MMTYLAQCLLLGVMSAFGLNRSELMSQCSDGTVVGWNYNLVHFMVSDSGVVTRIRKCHWSLSLSQKDEIRFLCELAPF